MTKAAAEAFFTLAGFEVKRCQEIPNEYIRDLTLKNPWWMVLTEFGFIKIGHRKQVVCIDWEYTGLKVKNVTADNVTKTETLVHAYTYPEVLEYLQALKSRMGTTTHLRGIQIEGETNV